MKFKKVLALTASTIATLCVGLVCLGPAGCGSSGSSKTTTTDTSSSDNPVPTLSALSVDNALIGSDDLALTITGTKFISTTKVSFDSNLITPTLVTATDMTITVPKALLTVARAVQVKASNPTPGGGTSNGLAFTIKNPLPTLNALSATTAYIGSPDLTLTLDGKGFVAGARVHFGSTDLTPAAVADAQLSVVVPSALFAATGTMPVSVGNPEPGGGASSAINFTVGNPIPTLTAFVASSTLVNSTNFVLEIDGKGFVAGSRLRFGSDEITPAAVTDTHLSAAVPDTLLTTARLVPVTVANPEPLGGASNSLDFAVNNPVPTITALSVETADAGMETDLPLSVTGENFVPGATVEFGPKKFTPGGPNSGSNRLDITIPAADLATGGMMAVTVTNPGPGGGPSNALQFRLNNPQPELGSVSPTSATAGDPAFDLTLTGNKFVSTTTIDFGGITLTPTSVSKNQMVVSVPETAFATGNTIQIKAVTPEPGGGPSGTMDFTINNPVPVISSTNPSIITNSGSDVTVSLVGSKFVSTSTVKIGADTVASTYVSNGEMQVSIPSATLSGASGSLAFTVNNPSPQGGDSNSVSVPVLNQAQLSWNVMANGTKVLPATTTPFANFSMASVNSSGLAAFRGQSVVTTSDGTGETSSTTGIYTADLANGGTIARVADISMTVPEPNELTYGQTLAKFGGFPSYPNVDASNPFVAFNATHPPVVSLVDGKGGSFGLYSNPDGVVATGVGAFVTTLNDVYDYFQVPELPGIPFGAFPYSPSAVGGDTLVFKGDYLNGTAVAMGIYYRDVSSSSAAVTRIASTFDSKIPGSTRTFAYFGAPTAVGNDVVFVGYDKKTAPTMGGIMMAPVSALPTITSLVKIGDLVPGSTTDTFTQFADPVAFDGRYVVFWGAWGTDMISKTLSCSDIQDPAMSSFCSTTVYPTGSTTVQVPAHQGIFLYDTQAEGAPIALAVTGSGFNNFAYYTFVGSLPEEGAPTDVGGGGQGGGGGETETEVPLEAPGFVLTPNVAVAGQSGSNYTAVFKGNTGSVDGIYMATGSGLEAAPALTTVLDTTMAGSKVDYNAPDTTQIKSLDLEHVGMSGTWLTIGSSLYDSATQSTLPGLYYTTLAN